MSKESGNKLTPEQQAITESRDEVFKAAKKEAKLRDKKEGRGLIRGFFNQEKEPTKPEDILHEEAIQENPQREIDIAHGEAKWENLERDHAEKIKRQELTEFHEGLNPTAKVMLDYLFGGAWANRNQREVLERLKQNYSIPLTDLEAIDLLVQFKKIKLAEAERSVEIWRETARKWGCSADAAVAYWMLPGFTLTKHAPKAGPCFSEDFGHLQIIKLKNNEPTKHAIVFWIPETMPGWDDDTLKNQVDHLDQLNLPGHKPGSVGNISILSNLILTHYNVTDRQFPYDNGVVRTDTCTRDGSSNIGLGWNEGRLGFAIWQDWDEDEDSDLEIFDRVVFAVGVEELPTE